MKWIRNTASISISSTDKNLVYISLLSLNLYQRELKWPREVTSAAYTYCRHLGPLNSYTTALFKGPLKFGATSNAFFQLVQLKWCTTLKMSRFLNGIHLSLEYYNPYNILPGIKSLPLVNSTQVLRYRLTDCGHQGGQPVHGVNQRSRKAWYLY